MVSIEHTEKHIWNWFRIKPNDTVPFCGWRADRDRLAAMFGHLGFNSGAELGVMDGVYSEKLCQANPNLKLKCIDVWRAFSRTTNEERASRHFRHARNRLTQYGCEFMKMTGMEASKLVQDGSLDFVYIDANHDFDSVIMDIITWTPKVRIGGIISGHDYNKLYQYGVIEAVNAYTRAHGINEWYVTSDWPASWMWVKKR